MLTLLVFMLAKRARRANGHYVYVTPDEYERSKELTLSNQFESIMANAKVCGGRQAGDRGTKRASTPTPVIWFPSAEELKAHEIEEETDLDICRQACLEEHADLMAEVAAGRWTVELSTTLYACEQALKRMGVEVEALADCRQADH